MWRPENGFGFVLADTGAEVFAHLYGIVDGKVPVQGDRITFDLQESDTRPGTFQACNISGGTGPDVPEAVKKKLADKAAKMNQFNKPQGNFSQGNFSQGNFAQSPGLGKNLNHVATGTFNGTVKSFVDKKSYGFILGPDGSSMFVHCSNIVDGRTLRQGDEVTFDIEASKTEEGKFIAINVAGGTGNEINFQPKHPGAGKNTDHVPTGLFSGKVKSFNSKKSWGFIVQADGTDVFVHQSAVVDNRILQVHDEVTFDVEEGKGVTGSKLVAKNVAGGTGPTPDEVVSMLNANASKGGKGGKADGCGDDWGKGWGCGDDWGKGGKGDGCGGGCGDGWGEGWGYGAAKGEGKGKGKDGPYGKGKMLAGMMASFSDDWGEGWDWGGKDGGKGKCNGGKGGDGEASWPQP